jgi:hypothetical protein
VAAIGVVLVLTLLFAPPRRAARGDPRLHPAGRGCQGRQSGRAGPS